MKHAICTLIILGTLGLNAAVLWEADFESPDYSTGTLTGQQGWYDDAANIQTVATGYDGVSPAEGSQFDYADALGITYNSNIFAAVTAMDKTNNYLRLSFYSLRKGQFNHNVGLYTTDGANFFVQCAGGTYSLAFNGGAALGSYVDETWSHVVVDIDCLGDTCKGVSGSVDGILAPGFSAPFSGPGLPHRIRLRPYGGSNLVDYTCFDGVKLETTPAFRVTPSSTAIGFTTPAPQVLTLTPELSGLSYDVTVSSSVNWVSAEPSTFTVTDSPVAVTVTVLTAGLILPTSAPLDVVSAEGVRKRLTVNVRSSLIAYEGYDYTAGLDIGGLDGGSGWDGPWSVVTPRDTQAVTFAGLSYENSGVTLAVEGNAFRIRCTADGSAVVNRQTATSYGSDNSTVWLSYLYKANSLGSGHNFVQPNGSQAAAIGRRWAGAFAIDNTSTSVTPVTNQTYLLVARYDCKAGADDVYLWVDPPMTEEPDINNADAMLAADIGTGHSLAFNVQGYGNNDIEFDEVRIGDTFADVMPSDVPSNVQASDGTYEDKVEVTWNQLEGASSYSVYRANTNDTSVATMLQGGLTTNAYADTTPVPLTIYWYWVKSDLSAVFSASDTGYRAQPGIPNPPQNVAASDSTYTDKVVITWDASAGATKYKVYRNTENNSGAAVDISGEITATTFDDTAVTPGQTYYYWLKAGSDGGWSLFSDPDTGSALYSSIAYEGFEYAAGPVRGKNGGLGWEGAWIASEDTVQTVLTEGLSYPGLQSGGGSLLMEAYFATFIPAEGRRSSRKNFSAISNDIWYSFLFKPVVQSDGHAFLILNNVWDCGSGKAWGNLLSLHNRSSDIVAENDQTFLMVVRCVNGGAYLWINPSLEREPATGQADVSQNTTTLGYNNDLMIQVQQYQATNSFIFDEVRIGYSWEQVTPNYIVKNVQASDGTFTDKVAVSWDGRSDAVGYTVYRNDVDVAESATALSSEITATTYDDTTATPGPVYYYWIKGRFTDGTEALSYSDAGYRAVSGAPDPPQNVQASDGVEGQKFVRVSWSASSGASTYIVYRNTVDDYAGAAAVSGEINSTQYDDSGVAAGVTYYYWVRARNASGLSNFSDSDGGYIPAQQVAYYAMNELEGTEMLDSSDNDFSGMYRDSPTLGMPAADAAFGTAVRFEISDAVINSNSPICDLTNNFTIAMWLKPTDTAQENRYLFSFVENGGWQLLTYDKQIGFDIPGAGGVWSPGNTLSNDTWTHVAVTFSQLNYGRMYLNGSPATDEIYIGAPATYVQSELLVANGGLEELFSGVLDEMHVYSGVLSDIEIAELAGVPEPGMLSILVLTALGAFIMRKR